MRKLGLLGIVFVGLVFLMNALGYVAFPVQLFFLSGLGTFQKVTATLGALVPVVASGVVGLYLLRSREGLSQLLFEEDETPPAISVDDLVRGGLLLTGVYLMIQSVPSLISQIGAVVVRVAESQQVAGVASIVLSSGDVRILVLRSLPGVLATLVSFGLGWFLLVRSRHIASRVTGNVVAKDAAKPTSLRACLSCGAVYDPSDYEGGLCEAKCPECEQGLDIRHA